MEKKRQAPLNGAIEGHGEKMIGELLTGGGIRALLWRALTPMWGRHLVACHRILFHLKSQSRAGHHDVSFENNNSSGNSKECCDALVMSATGKCGRGYPQGGVFALGLAAFIFRKRIWAAEKKPGVWYTSNCSS